MTIKLMIDRDSYQRLVRNGKAVGVYALNDYVSSTRKDPARLLHTYGSRRELLRAAIRANGGVAVLVNLVDDIHYECPIKAFVTGVGQVVGDGLRFLVSVAGGPATAKPEKGGAK